MFGRLEGTLPTPPVACRQRSPTLPTTEATMRCVRQASVRAALTVLFASSGWYSGAVAQDPRSALDPITSAVMKHPITTSSATARDHFLRGKRELDRQGPGPRAPLVRGAHGPWLVVSVRRATRFRQSVAVHAAGGGTGAGRGWSTHLAR